MYRMHRHLMLSMALVTLATSTPLAADPPDPTPAQPSQATPVPAPPSVRRALAGVLEGASAPSAKAIPTPPAGSWGVVSEGDGGGGIFRDTDSDAEAWLGSGANGVIGYGSMSGGFFQDSDNSGFARLGWGDFGLVTGGNLMGALAADADGSGYAWLGYDRPSGTDLGGDANDGEYGMYAGGAMAGGYFEDTDSSGYAYVGSGNYGIKAYGSSYGGYFKDSDSTGWARIAYGNSGVQGFGSFTGGYFFDTDGTGFAYAGYDRPTGTDNGGEANDGEYGVYAGGSKAGAYFEDTDNPGYAYIGVSDYGIKAYGLVAAGYFEHTGLGSEVTVGGGYIGVDASGYEAGGLFIDDNDTGWAWLGYEDHGIEASGSAAGGYFWDTNSSGEAYVGYGSYKIYGTGAVSFVQNHPRDPGSVIVYAAPEGDEVATYTRGTARLEGGEARVALGETFQWVTNPDIGLTAFVTPVTEWCDLYVAEQATESILVRSRDGSDCAFNFVVYGLRIGFEESAIVQEKRREAFIPSMADHRDLAARRPDLARHTALARWTAQRKAIGAKEPLDLNRAHALRDLIGEYDPAVHGSLAPQRPERYGVAELREGAESSARATVAGRSRAPDAGSQPADRDRGWPTFESPAPEDVYARSFRPAAGDLARLLEVSEPVEAGDVLVVDPGRPGTLRVATVAADPTVVGVVAAAPGVVLGSASDIESGRAPVAFSGIATCKVDAGYGPVFPGDLLVSSPTPGHAMRTDVPLPGAVLGKALEELTDGTATIRILVMPR